MSEKLYMITYGPANFFVLADAKTIDNFLYVTKDENEKSPDIVKFIPTAQELVLSDLDEISNCYILP